MALTSGFYNAIKVGGVYDRKYNADDYRNVFAAFIHDGVRRSGDNDLFVSSSGLVPSVGIGYAVCGGRWVRNDTVYNLPAVTPPVGDFNRMDAVVLRVNENEAVRAASIEYRYGNPASTPIPPERDEQLGIAELVLAHVLVSPNATHLTVIDTRPDDSVCGWITTPVGYDDYFASLDAESIQWQEQRRADFDQWFSQTRTDLANVTLYKQYVWRTVLESSATTVAFNIPQFDSTGVDIIEVYVNGLRETDGVDYTVQGSSIVFSDGGGGTGIKSAGTEIVVLCYKSIDGRGIGSFVDEITNLQNAVATLGDISEYNYICNGATDNVVLSELAQTFLAGDNSDNKRMTIRVYGTLGANAPYIGDGSASNPFKWFALGLPTATSRRIIFDFENATKLTINARAGASNIIFSGYNMHVRNAVVTVNANSANTPVVAFDCKGRAYIDECSILINGNKDCYIGADGEYNRCNFNVRNSAGASACFKAESASLLRITNCEVFAYGMSGANGMGVHVPAAATGAVVICNGVLFPTFTVSGMSQTHAVLDLSANGLSAYNNCITNLPVTATGQSVTGTLKANRYNKV